MSEAGSDLALADYFSKLTDPRTGKTTYPLLNMVVMMLCAVTAGADDFVAITRWANAHKEWLAKFLDLSNGIPSHDRFNSVLARLKPAEFEACLLQWITAMHEATDGEVIAIDGKSLRRSYDRASSKSAIHMVSAWASAQHISLGQVVCEAKSNEITAIPKLLEMLELKGALVTIDAMGCQKEIAAKIVEGKANYCLAAKKNQRKLYKAINEHFEMLSEHDFQDARLRQLTGQEHGHGRDEYRHYVICPVPESVQALGWTNLKAIGMAVNITERNGKQTTEIRYYILSRYVSAKRFANAVRSHWGIENSLHWQLDVTFGEDQCRVRQGHAATNLSLLRRAALSLLKKETSAKVGVKNKRLTAAWDSDYLTKVLFG